jgi:hypothetical protein
MLLVRGKLGLALAALLCTACLSLWADCVNAEPKPVRPRREAEPVDPAVAERLRQTLAAEPSLPDDTANELRGILADPKYSSGGIDAVEPTWLEKFLDWLGRIFKGTGLPMDNGWIVLATGAVILAVLYLVVRIGWELLQRRGPRRRTELKDVAPEEMSAAGLLAAATAAAQRGDFRSAIRLRFLALVKELGLPAASWQTNSQLARAIRRLQPAAATPFATAASRYEEVWYGGAAGSRADFEGVQAAALEVLAMLPQPAAEAA